MITQNNLPYLNLRLSVNKAIEQIKPLIKYSYSGNIKT